MPADNFESNFESDVSLYIEQALLVPGATPEQAKQCCEASLRYQFPAVCLYPSAIRQATEILHNSKTQICTVIGFPTGASTTATKCFEAQEAVELGATELDVVINLGWLKSGQSEAIYKEVATICEETGQVVKAILETNVLSDTEKRLAAEICMDAGVQYLKTGTGWFGGATVADVTFLKKLTQGRVGIKAAGGIRTLSQAVELIAAGANRLGTSRGPELVQQQQQIHEEV